MGGFAEMKTLTINDQLFEIVDEKARTEKLNTSELPVAIDAALAQAKESGLFAGIVVQETAPVDTSVLWVDMDDDDNDGFQEAVNMALAQAKASGEFDGISLTHSWSGTVLTITSASGSSSADLRGPRYELTDADKASIAEAVVDLLPVYNGEVV